MTLAQGTTLWMAPEVFSKLPYSFNADVWSFGIILGEIATREEPFAKVSFFEALKQMGEGMMPELPEKTPEQICTLRRMCLQSKPEMRPSAETLFTFLEEAAEKTPELKMPEAEGGRSRPSSTNPDEKQRIASGEEIKSLIYALESGNWGYDDTVKQGE